MVKKIGRVVPVAKIQNSLCFNICIEQIRLQPHCCNYMVMILYILFEALQVGAVKVLCLYDQPCIEYSLVKNLLMPVDINSRCPGLLFGVYKCRLFNMVQLQPYQLLNEGEN